MSEPSWVEFGKTPRELARDSKRRRRKVGESYLTPREYAVVQMLGSGMTGPAAAAKLRISQKTVWGLTGRARQRMGAKTNTELVAMCAKSGAL